MNYINVKGSYKRRRLNYLLLDNDLDDDKKTIKFLEKKVENMKIDNQIYRTELFLTNYKFNKLREINLELITLLKIYLKYENGFK